MRGHRLLYLLLLAFFIIAMVYPLAHVVGRAFVIDGTPSLHFFSVLVSSEYYREVFANSLNIAIAVTLISTLIAYPLALVMSRYSLPTPGVLHAFLLLPLISPPFVGALGVKQIFGRFGSVNIMLIEAGVIDRPIQWLASGSAFGIILLQTIHLVPILYLSVSASLRNAHVSLEESARVCGASRYQVLRRVIIPLSLPGWFAGASLVFIASFTDLGTPLIFDFRGVIPVQIYNMLSDLNENPVGYSLVVFTCTVSLLLFFLSRTAMAEGSYAASARTRQGRLQRQLSPFGTSLLTICIWAYISLSLVPQVAVLLIASARTWFATILPSEWTLDYFTGVLNHSMTANSLLTSTWLSVVASLITVCIGFLTAYIIARVRGHWSWSFEVLSLIPLAVPGIVFAFGFIGAYAGTIVDNRINPFPLLLIAYSIRRMPAMVRSGTAGLAEASVTLEEAATVLGASPGLVMRRIIVPLISKHLLVGGILTFAYSMIEVSDSLLLAMEVRFYPVSKAIYALTGRPDGVELASALGSIVMVMMLAAFYLAEWVSAGADKKRIVVGAFAAALFFGPMSASAQEDELVAVTPHWEGIKFEFENGFKRAYLAETGRSVRIRWLDIGGTSDIVKYLKAQSRPDSNSLGIDIMFGGGTDAFLELSRNRVLARTEISPSIKARIPNSISGVPLCDRNGEWFAAAVSIFGIIVNTVAAERLGLPLPQTWADLGRPEYHDLVAIADPSKSGSMHAMYEVILQGYGWEKGWQILSRIAANARAINNHASQVGKDVATGESIFGIAIDTYAGDVIRQVGRERVAFVTPKDYATINGDGIAVLRGASHPNLAKHFLEFVLSEEGQKLWYYKRGTPGGPVKFEIGKLPVIPDLYDTGSPATVVPGNPFTFTSVLSFDADLASKRWNLVNDLFAAFIVEIHDRLVAFARLNPGRQPPTVTLTSTDAVALSPQGAWGSDQVDRSRYLKIWRDLAAAALPSFHSPLYTFRWLPSLAMVGFLLAVIVRRISRSYRSRR